MARELVSRAFSFGEECHRAVVRDWHEAGADARRLPGRVRVPFMSVRYRNITEATVDPERVTVRVLAAPDGTVLGRVSTLAYGDSGIELMSTEDADPPIETALRLAAELAAFKEQDVDVIDVDGLWRPEWGRLDPG